MTSWATEKTRILEGQRPRIRLEHQARRRPPVHYGRAIAILAGLGVVAASLAACGLVMAAVRWAR